MYSPLLMPTHVGTYFQSNPFQTCLTLPSKENGGVLFLSLGGIYYRLSLYSRRLFIQIIYGPQKIALIFSSPNINNHEYMFGIRIHCLHVLYFLDPDPLFALPSSGSILFACPNSWIQIQCLRLLILDPDPLFAVPNSGSSVCIY